jgi:hypothetical protein
MDAFDFLSTVPSFLSLGLRVLPVSHIVDLIQVSEDRKSPPLPPLSPSPVPTPAPLLPLPLLFLHLVVCCQILGSSFIISK